MPLVPRSELATIARIAELLGGGGGATRGVIRGIGDDAAVLDPQGGRELVWTVDAQFEGQHFRRGWLTLEDVGWRSFVAAASDLAAMGAVPWCALSALGVPENLGDADLDALVTGQRQAADAVGCPVVGGNLSRAGELSVTTTLLGTAKHAVRRGGAKPGEGVWLGGHVGLAALGLEALRAGRWGGELDAAVAAFRRPRVNIADGKALAGRASAAIDVSDGLAADVAHLCEASGVRVVLDRVALQGVSEVLRSMAGDGWLELALHGGEDYALVATSAEALPGFERVGVVEEGAGVWLASGERREVIAPRGFDHFAFRPLLPALSSGIG